MRSMELRTSTDAIVRMLRSVDDGVLGVIPESSAAAKAGAWSALVSIPQTDTSLTHLPVAGSRGRSVTLMAHRSRLKRILDAYGRIRPTLDDDYYVVESRK